MSFKPHKVVRSGLCLGCGLCEEIGRFDGMGMTLADSGFYEPRGRLARGRRSEAADICPGIHLDCVDTRDSFCGPVEAAWEGWATDQKIRHSASSGGVITALATYLLATGRATGVLQVGAQADDCLRNELRISRNAADVLSCCSSRYAPARMFDRIGELLGTGGDRLAFVGKPCDIMALQRYLDRHPEHPAHIAWWISLVCAGMPSYNATSRLIGAAGHGKSVTSLKYRGDGWPGEFRARFDDGSTFSCSYNESWGRVLGRDVRFRCKICPDGMGQYADVVVGDAWHTFDQNGYPDFTEQQGRSFILARNKRGRELVEQSGVLELTDFDTGKLQQMQPYQWLRLQSIFYRLVPAWILTGGKLRIKRLRLPRFSLIAGAKITLGTSYRYWRKPLLK